MEYSIRSGLGSVWRFLHSKSDGHTEVLEVLRKSDKDVKEGVINLYGVTGGCRDIQLMDVYYEGGETGIYL
jgi:hypothetical protein